MHEQHDRLVGESGAGHAGGDREGLVPQHPDRQFKLGTFVIQEMDVQYMKLLKKEGVVSWYGEGGMNDDWRAIVPSDYIP